MIAVLAAVAPGVLLADAVALLEEADFLLLLVIEVAGLGGHHLQGVGGEVDDVDARLGEVALFQEIGLRLGRVLRRNEDAESLGIGRGGNLDRYQRRRKLRLVDRALLGILAFRGGDAHSRILLPEFHGAVRPGLEAHARRSRAQRNCLVGLALFAVQRRGQRDSRRRADHEAHARTRHSLFLRRIPVRGGGPARPAKRQRHDAGDHQRHQCSKFHRHFLTPPSYQHPLWNTSFFGTAPHFSAARAYSTPPEKRALARRNMRLTARGGFCRMRACFASASSPAWTSRTDEW